MHHYASFLYTIAPTLRYFQKFSSDNPHIGIEYKITQFKPIHYSLPFILLEYSKEYRAAEYSEYLRPEIMKTRKYILKGVL